LEATSGQGEIFPGRMKNQFTACGNRPYYDGSGELRIKNTFFFWKLGIFETHYEAVFSGGDTRKKSSNAALFLSNIFNTDINISGLQRKLIKFYNARMV